MSTISVTLSSFLFFLLLFPFMHCTFMEEIFLVKDQTNVKSKKKIHTITFRQRFLTHLKFTILTIKIGVIFFV